jgi:hypothetical protein
MSATWTVLLPDLEDFWAQLQSADDLALANLAKFRSSPPEASGLDASTYNRLFSKALADAYDGLEQLPQADDLYALLDSSAALVVQRIQASPTLDQALQASGASAAEASVRAFVLASALRPLAPQSLSEFAAAVLKIPVAQALDLPPDLEGPAL